MRIVWISRDVRIVSGTCEFARRNELTVDHLAGYGAPHNMEAHEAGHSNASAHGATRGRERKARKCVDIHNALHMANSRTHRTLQEAFHPVALPFEVVKFLWL